MADAPNSPEKADPTANAQDESTLWDSLKKAAENAINLQIVTTIGNVEISGDIKRPEVKLLGDGTDQIAIVTNINLVDGDISSVIPEAYAGQIDSPIMKYHAERVSQAHATIDKNVATIATLLKDVVPLLKP